MPDFRSRVLGDGTGSPLSYGSGKWSAPGQQSSIEAGLRASAARYGFNPDDVMALANAEGFKSPFKSTDSDGRPSYGALQMHQGGLADEFQKATGLDPSDPKNEQAMNDWGIWYASKHGFGKWSSVTGGRVPAPRMTGSGAGAGFGSAPDAATAMEKNPLFKDHAALSN